MYEAREIAIERMQAEAAAAKAEGVVGVDIHEGSHGWQTHVIEFFAIGTAVLPLSRKSRPKKSPIRSWCCRSTTEMEQAGRQGQAYVLAVALLLLSAPALAQVRTTLTPAPPNLPQGGKEPDDPNSTYCRPPQKQSDSACWDRKCA